MVVKVPLNSTSASKGTSLQSVLCICIIITNTYYEGKKGVSNQIDSIVR